MFRKRVERAAPPAFRGAGKCATAVLAVAALPGSVFPCCAQGTSDADSAKVERPAAVFLIVVDTLRPDRLSCYGYDAHATPSIDRLAAAGVRFTRAQSVASWTVPSVAGIITSRYPRQLGLIEKPVPPGKTLAWREVRRQRSRDVPRYARTLAELLREAGYLTAAFVNQPALNGPRGYRRGFVQWHHPLGPDEVGQCAPQERFKQEWPSARQADGCDRALIRELERWLARNGREKLFVWLHLLTPHRPYVPTPEHAPAGPAGESPSPSALYDAEVRGVDDMLRLVVEAIDRHVGMKRSLIVFTSDHGEAFGEHGMVEHGHSLHREVVHVPLIIVSPSLPAGRTVEQYVRTIDILPTILDIIGQSGLAPADAAGVALTPLIAAGGPSLSVYSEGMLYGSSERCLIEGAHKLMYDEQGQQWKLYDLSTDPAETVDLAAQLPERVESMRQRLIAWHARLGRDFESWQREHPTRPPEDEEQQRDLEALRALGYVGDE